MTAYDGAILEREDEVKRREAQRVTLGWNFCTWFLLKVRLEDETLIRCLVSNFSGIPRTLI